MHVINANELLLMHELLDWPGHYSTSFFSRITIFFNIVIVKNHGKGSSGSSESDESEDCSDERDLKTKYVCEDDEMHIKCPKGHLVHILWVLYGRDCDDKCVSKHDKGTQMDTNCSSSDALGVVQKK